MTDYTLMTLVNWLESVACKFYYVFDGLYVKPRCMTPDRKEKREQYYQDAKDLVALCQDLYKLQLPYKPRKEQP